MSELAAARGGNRRLDRYIEDVKANLGNDDGRELQARRITERIALVLQGALLVRHGPSAIADAFCASRLDGDWGHTFGTLPAETAFDEIIGYGRVAQ